MESHNWTLLFSHLPCVPLWPPMFSRRKTLSSFRLHIAIWTWRTYFEQHTQSHTWDHRTTIHDALGLYDALVLMQFVLRPESDALNLITCSLILSKGLILDWIDLPISSNVEHLIYWCFRVIIFYTLSNCPSTIEFRVSDWFLMAQQFGQGHSPETCLLFFQFSSPLHVIIKSDI